MNLVKQGTLTLYHQHSELHSRRPSLTCTAGVGYGPGSVFTTSPDEVHLAKNVSTSEPLVFFAVYLAPKQTPDLPVRIDQPLPAPGCPQ